MVKIQNFSCTSDTIFWVLIFHLIFCIQITMRLWKHLAFHWMALSANQMFTLDQISIVNQNSVISTTVWKVKNFPSLKFLKISKVYRFWAKLWIVSRINLIHIFYLNKAYNCVYRQVRNLELFCLFYESSSVSLTPSNVEGLIPSGTSFLLNLKNHCYEQLQVGSILKDSLRVGQYPLCCFFQWR